MRSVQSLTTRVCSLKVRDGCTALACCVHGSNSPAILEALVKAKANVNAVTYKVRHLQNNRCEPYVVIDHSCVIVGAQNDSSDRMRAILQLGHHRALVEGESQHQRGRHGEAFGV